MQSQILQIRIKTEVCNILTRALYERRGCAGIHASSSGAGEGGGFHDNNNDGSVTQMGCSA